MELQGKGGEDDGDHLPAKAGREVTLEERYRQLRSNQEVRKGPPRCQMQNSNCSIVFSCRS